MFSQHRVIRALLLGAYVLISGLLVYEGVPTTLDQLWQPALQGFLAVFGALGINGAVVRRRAE